jgi:hypothetical protein
MKREKVEAIIAVGILCLVGAIALLFAILNERHSTAVVPPPVEHHEVAPAKDTATPATLPAPLTISTPAQAKPNLAILGADWCGPCRRVERDVIPHLLPDPAISLLLVDIDVQPDLAAKLINPKNNTLPQFVAVEAVGGEIRPHDWLTGYHAAQAVKDFLKAKPAIAEPDAPASPSQPAACQPATGPLRRLFNRGKQAANPSHGGIFRLGPLAAGQTG